MIPTSARRRIEKKTTSQFLLRPLLILWVQSDLALVHCPSIIGDNPEGETNKQTNKWRRHVWSCIVCRVWCTMHQSTWRSFGDALERHGVQYAGSHSDITPLLRGFSLL